MRNTQPQCKPATRKFSQGIRPLGSRDLIAYWEFFLAQNLNMPGYAGDYIRSYQRLTDAILTGDSRSAKSIWQYHVEWVIAILKGEHVEPGTPWIR